MYSMRSIIIIIAAILFHGTVMADNLLKNNGFEEIDTRNNFPTYWSINPAYPGECQVVVDASISHQGSRCLKIGQPSGEGHVAVVQEKLPLGNQKELTVSIWAKGHGTFYFYCYLYDQVKFLGSIASDGFKIDHESWKQYSVPVIIPEKAGESSTRVENIALAIHVEKGPVWIDDAALFWKGEEPKAESHDETESPFPFIVISKTKSAPVIDGIWASNEWEQATEATGFHQLNGKLSNRQTNVYVTHDDKNLYFAFNVLIAGAYDDGKNLNVGKADAVEIWLMPPGQGWYQFYGTPSGNFLINSQKAGQTWKAAWQYKSRVEDLKEAAGGILSFDKKRWIAEVSIPFKDLGVTCPKNGETWRLNFCRDFSGKSGQERTVDDWTSWSRITSGFSNYEMFGIAEFRDDAPAIQVESLGDLEAGNVSIIGRMNGVNASQVDVEAIVKTEGEPEHIISKKTSRVMLSSGKSAAFNVKDDIKVNGKTEMLLLCGFQDVNTHKLLYQFKLPFTCNTSFSIKVAPIYSRKKLFVEADTSRVGGLPEQYRLKIEVPGTDILKSQEMSLKENKACLQFDMSGIKPGDYVVKGTLLDPQGKILASSSELLPMPKKPVWLGNQIGVAEEVPPPWKPIEVDNKRVMVTQRKYLLGDNGLPCKIEDLGEDLLAAPATISARVGGADVIWKFNELKMVKKTTQEVVFEIYGVAKGLRLKGNLRIEFDGFSLFSFEVDSPEHLTLDSLALEFPLKKGISKYARATAGLPAGKSYYASLYKNVFKSAKDVDLGKAGLWNYSPQWKWNNTFFTEIWIGDDRKGLAVMCESDQNIRGNKQTEIMEEGMCAKLKINLISAPYVLNQPLRYEYAYQATPVKPRPEDPKLWHASYFIRWPDEYLKRLYVACVYHLTKPIDYPAMRNPEGDGPLIKKAQECGARVVTDTYMSAAELETPEFKLYGPEWKVIPENGWSTQDGIARHTCHSSTYPDFYLYAVKRWVEEFGLNGVYVDVSSTMPCENQYHDCGYMDAEGKKHPVFHQWATRDFYKRLYTYLHTGGNNGVVFSHTMCQTSYSGFLDVVTEGEEWGTEEARQYRQLSPDMFRAKEMKNQWGTPYTFYSFHQYTWRGSNFGEPVPFHEILMMCLPHHVLPTIGDEVGGKAIIPIWDLLDAWWTTSDFIPYWSPQSPAKSSMPESVLGSVYLKKNEKKALLVVSNWNYVDANAEITFNWKQFGFEPRKVIKDAMNGTEISVEGNQIKFPLPKRNFRIFQIE